MRNLFFIIAALMVTVSTVIAAPVTIGALFAHVAVYAVALTPLAALATVVALDFQQ